MSAGQVSSGVGISLNVQIEPEAVELVRCTACHGCPDCGGTAWLAMGVPVDQTDTSFEQ